MIQLQQAVPRSAEPLAMFLFLKYTKVYILNLLRSMTTIALFLRKNSSLLEDNPDHQLQSLLIGFASKFPKLQISIQGNQTNPLLVSTYSSNFTIISQTPFLQSSILLSPSVGKWNILGFDHLHKYLNSGVLLNLDSTFYW